MSFIDAVVLGIIIMAIIYWFTRKPKKDNVILFDKDAERREKWAIEQAKYEAEMDKKLQEYKEKKDKFYKLKEQLDNGKFNNQRTDNGNSLHNSSNVADVYVLNPKSSKNDDPS